MYVLQQRIRQVVMPSWMLGLKGEVQIVCSWPWSEPFKHDCITESGSDGCVKIKAWRKIVVKINHNLEKSCSLFSIMDNLNGVFGFVSFHTRVSIRSKLLVVNLNNQVIKVKLGKIFVLNIMAFVLVVIEVKLGKIFVLDIMIM